MVELVTVKLIYEEPAVYSACEGKSVHKLVSSHVVAVGVQVGVAVIDGPVTEHEAVLTATVVGGVIIILEV